MSNFDDTAADSATAHSESARPVAGTGRPRRASKARQIINSRRVIHHRRRK